MDRESADPRSNENASDIVRGRVRKPDSTSPQNHHGILCPRTRQHAQTASVHTRAGALTFPSSCLEGSVTRVGPGRNPQYTRAWLANNQHRAQPRHPMSPTTLLTRRGSFEKKKRQNEKIMKNEDTNTKNEKNQDTTKIEKVKDNLSSGNLIANV